MEDNNLKTKVQEPGFTKSTFLTTVAHQLRNLLAGARWSIEIATKDKDCPNKEILTEGLNKIVHSIDIVGEILKLSNNDLVGEEIELKKDNFILNDLVKKIISNLNFLIQEKGTTITCEEKGSFEINGDEKMLGMVLTNVFDNALRYSPKGKVFISLEKEDSFVKITVKDTGIGISSSDLEHIFQKFFRGENAKEIDPNETGVGLYTTKKIVEMFGGKIAISSVLNKGTTVEISLPLLANKV